MVLNFGPKRSTAPLATLVVAIVLIAALVVYDRSSDTKGELVLATTTSTYDSGLLDHIIPEFERTFDVSVKVVATGTGQALRLGRTGDADVVMVHSPLAEMEFVKEGYGPYRVGVMHNEFVLVGPADDPAGIRALPTVAQALEAIFETGSTFCSRGDDSGTHMKERSLWDLTAVQYETIASRKNSDWYLALGQGMGDTLRIASDLGAYTLTDDGTFYALMDDLELVILNSGDTALVNPYSVIPVNGTRHPNVEEDLAQKFADWIVSDDIQVMIDSYSRDGRTLFSADAVEI
jgi:tungstate transport system substrate-binding protein